ncbi:MAG: ubiquinol-cytochrome c reductase iron-sulfur subunit, partial [Betaproteobacteria bacterium HGW-Betaproteobacteria-17]
MSQEVDGQKVDARKRKFLIAATSAVGGVAVAGVALPLVMSMMPSARARAAGAPVEVDIDKIEPGMLLTIEWRGKPVWIVNRTPEMLDLMAKHDDKLADPRSEMPQQPEYCKNAVRSIKPEYL